MYENKKIKNVQIDYDKMVNQPEYIIKGNRYYFSYEKVRELFTITWAGLVIDTNYSLRQANTRNITFRI